jgi:glycosyltransferase involved in cell wall biosynthesis
MQIDVEGKCGGKRFKGIVAQSRPALPLVSVITAVYNGLPDLSSCLDSVIHQDYPNIEHIVLDGGSRDGTVDVLRQYDDQVALWRSEPDSGIYDAWNKALLEAGGEWICFLGADDAFVPGAVSAYMALAAKNPEAEYLSSQVKVLHPSGYERTLGSPWTWKKFSRSMCTPHVGSMHRRSLFDRLGAYDTSYRIVGDYELLLRARHQLKTSYMPAITVVMKYGGISTSRVALVEQARAKVATGNRSRVLAAVELYLGYTRTILHPPVRYALGKIVAPRHQ